MRLPSTAASCSSIRWRRSRSACSAARWRPASCSRRAASKTAATCRDGESSPAGRRTATRRIRSRPSDGSTCCAHCSRGMASRTGSTRGLPYGPEIGHGAGARRCRVVRVAEWHGVGRLANPGERGAKAQLKLELGVAQLVCGVLDERQLLGGERKAQLAVAGRAAAGMEAHSPLAGADAPDGQRGSERSADSRSAASVVSIRARRLRHTWRRTSSALVLHWLARAGFNRVDGARSGGARVAALAVGEVCLGEDAVLGHRAERLRRPRFGAVE